MRQGCSLWRACLGVAKSPEWQSWYASLPCRHQRAINEFTLMKVILAQPRGFCAGVVRAIEIVERALEKYGPPVYVRHEIVHNKHVVESLKAKGARFVEDLSEVPADAVTVFSAHGVAKSVEDEAAARKLPVLNATCPLVTKVHNQGKRYVGQGRKLILIGHAGHPEVEGSELGEAWLERVGTVGITAGASAPEVLVEDVIAALRRRGPVDVSVLPGRQEKIEFRLPAELAKAS